MPTNPATYTGPLSLNTVPNSPFWMVSFIAPDGSQRKRSTKVPHKGGMYLGDKLSAAQARKRAERVGYDIACQVWAKEEDEAKGVNNMTVRELFDIMLNGKLGRVSADTYNNARTDYNQFCEWLGKRADKPARLITRAVINEWILARRVEVRCNTTKKALTAISSAFRWAVDSEIMPANPCLGAKVPPDTKDERIVKEAFTLDEIRLLIDKLPDEWSSAVRCCMGVYGQRLGDVLSLKWEQFDFSARVVRIVTGKTAAYLAQPMTDEFFAWARARYEDAQRIGGEAAIYVHPRLHRHTNPSQEFTQLVRLHGIGMDGKKAAGRRRTWHSKTFHCMRSTSATMLQVSGVSEGIAQQLVGHDSTEVHRVYLKPSAEQLAEIARHLPAIGKKDKRKP